MKSFIYLSVFAVIFALSLVSIPDAHAISVTISNQTSCETIPGAAWTTSPNTCSLITSGQIIANGEIWTVDPSVTLAIQGGIGITNNGTIINNGIITPITFGNIAFIINNGIITNNGTIDNLGDITNSGTITTNSFGTISNNSGGDITNNSGGIITLNSSSNFYGGGILTNNFGGTVDNYGYYSHNGGTLNNSGDFINRLGATLYNDAIGTVINTSTGTIDNFGFFSNNSSSTFTNDGLFTNEPGSLFRSYDSIINSGTIDNLDTFDNGGNLDNSGIITNQSIFNNSDGFTTYGTINNFGTVTNNLGSLINNPNGNIYNNSGGLITNSGDIDNATGIIDNYCGATYSGNAPTGNAVNNLACLGPAFNQPTYDLGTSAIITVTDAAANTNALTIQTIPVQVSSTSDPGFLLTATETGLNTGIFTATVLLSDSATNASLNVLHVDSGQSISATYNLETASANVVPPGVSGIDAGVANVIRFDSDVYYLNTAGFIKVNAPSGSCTLNNGVVNTLTANIVSTTSTLSNVALVENNANSCQFTSQYQVTFSNLSTITAGATQRINVSPNTLVTITLNGNGSTGNTLIVPTPASVVIAGTQLPAAGITCSADLDQDGICDTWEVANTPLDHIPIGSATYSYKDGAACPRLIDDRTTPFVDAGNPNTCPSPTKKDVFVEIDYMQNHRPSNAALLAVVNAYASAPTATISGVTPGITLHIQLDEQLPFHDVVIPMNAAVGSAGAPHGGFLQLKETYFGTPTEHTATQSVPQSFINNLLDAKAQVFHYSLWIHSLTATPNSSGYAEVWGNDSIISLGAFADGEGTVDQQSATFMHELGHNLKLNHGGSGTAAAGYQNCKPNYISVMNYAFQFKSGEGGYISNRPLDYSRLAQTTLNEASLSESTGISVSSPAGLTTVYAPVPVLTKVLSAATNAVDWNRNGDTVGTALAVDVNDFDISGCNDDDVPLTVQATYVPNASLSGYNDWTGVDLKFRPSASYADGSFMETPSPPPLAVNPPQSFDEMSAPVAQAINGKVLGKSPPVLTSTGSPYSANQNVPIVFSATATDADNDLASILWALDNDDNYNDANGVSKSFSQAGTYTVLVKATDATGLTDTALVTVIISDVTPPITTAAPLGGTYNTAQSVTLTANEAAAIYYTTNGSIPTTSSTQYSAAIPISATTTLKYFAKDTAGNSEAVKTQTYTITVASTPQFVAKWGSSGTGNGQFTTPRGTELDLSGNVIVADSGNNRIQKFTNTGTFMTKWGSSGSTDGKFNNPTGIAVDASGNIYIADSGNNRIQKFTSAGVFVSKFGSSGSTGGKFNNPTGIAIDSSGNVYVADTGNNRIQKFTSAGVFVSKWGSSGSTDGKFSSPTGLGLDSSGNVYVADTGNNRIQKFTSAGVFVSKWGSSGSTDGKFSSPTGLGIDSSNNVFVDDRANNRVQKFTSAGVFVSKFGSLGSGNTQFNSPNGITSVDSSGNIYIGDTNNNRVSKWKP